MMKKHCLILLLLSALCAPVFSSTSNILPAAGVAMSFLDIGAGARYIALGGAATALAGDASCVEWNPGTLGAMRDTELNLEYKKWFMDSLLMHISGAYPLGPGTLAAAISYINMGTFEQLDEQGFLTGQSFSPAAFVLSAGYGMKLPGISGLSAGASLRFAYESVIGTSVVFTGVDIGAFYKMNDIFSFGAAAQNVGFMTQNPAPLNFRLGAAATFLNVKDFNATLLLDGYVQNQTGSLASAGLECEAFDTVMLRAGYKVVPDRTANTYSGLLSAGAGVRAGVFKFDYAFQMFGDLGVNHTVSVGILYKEMPKALSLKEYENIVIKTYYRDAVTSYKMGDFEAAYTLMSRTLALAPDNKAVLKWVEYFKKAAEYKKQKEAAAAAAGVVVQKQQIDVAYEYYKGNNYTKA